MLSGILALLIRIQLARPDNRFLGPDLYNQIFTTHGTAMMFLFAVPIMEGIGLYLVPLMIGTRNVAFPRLMSFGYYVYLTAGVMLFTGLFLNVGPDMGWFAYTPLSGPDYSPGKRSDIWNQMITMVEISSLAEAVELIVTIFRLRAPGMTLNRMPLFVWSQLVTAWMIVFAMPVVMTCSTMLATDRLVHVNTQFFNQAEGGDPLLWQHLFWFFAHPEVYIIFIPAVGFVSTMLSTFCRRAAVRLHGAGALERGHGVHRLRRVGPPHVRHAVAAPGPGAVHRGEPDDRDPERGPDVLLARDALGRPAVHPGADGVRAGVHRRVHDRRPLGDDAGVGVARPAGA